MAGIGSRPASWRRRISSIGFGFTYRTVANKAAERYSRPDATEPRPVTPRKRVGSGFGTRWAPLYPFIGWCKPRLESFLAEHTLESGAVAELAAGFEGQLIQPGDPDY